MSLLSGSSFQKEPSVALLPFEIKNGDNTGIYLTYSVYYFGGGQELLFCLYEFFPLTWSDDDIDVVFKVKD
jgi:hypothetical protein